MVKNQRKQNILILSTSAIEENIRSLNNPVLNLVKEYCNLPLLPTSQETTIKKIGAYNHNPITKQAGDYIQYSMFTSENPNEFPLGVNPETDYMPDEYVSPVVIIDNNDKRYRVNYILWFPLVDIHDKIIRKQASTQQKIFPYKIFIDEGVMAQQGTSYKWIAELFNLTL